MLLLYLHSAQLDTADLHYQRLGATFCCRLGCAATENAYYIFVQCSAFREIWGSHLQALEQATSNLLSAELPYMGEALCAISHCLFCDDEDFWPQVHSMYYLGVLPSLAKVCCSHNLHVSETVLVLVAQAWHTHSIRLTAHVWAEFKHHLGSRSFYLPSDVPHVDLPEHLSYLM